ncbi:DUF1294 domain-containing protein [Roseomonas sp. CECT 9278]|uniref:DUF1294 domain-containing protein n=1 Tax=Roseomonas sp. CECT 9278 TaxID=2845823 RepID=UPI001E53C345|nr:DUF1294 domain-containing protein [Roseomonas sp. CECT 9278]CAH0238075.1 hypothetical protein ROS9278_02820 [Roseomonas sp. CECT 9278]
MLTDAQAWVLGVGCWLLGMNVLSMALFHHDKRMAEQRGWRISERMLLTVALLGGSPGALLARRRFRHKTRKQPFSAALHAVCLLQLVAVAWLAVNGPTLPPAVARQLGAFITR